MDTLAFYLWSVPIGEKLGREIGGRAGRVLRAIREAFPDEAMPSPDALAEAFEWKKRTAPHLNLPRKPEGVLAILYEYRDFTRRKAQGAPATTGPGTVPYVRALTAEEIERARHPDDDDIPPIPKPKVDYRGFPIPSDDDQGGDT